MMRLALASALLFIVSIAPAPLLAGVSVRDDVALAGTPVMLSATVKGTLLPRGGVLVEFSVEGRSLGKVLSGGDGVAFKEYIPRKAGLLKVKAVDGEEEGEGYLLSVRKGSGVVLLDVDGGIFKSDDVGVGILPVPGTLREGALETVKSIAKRRSVVYLSTGPLGVSFAKRMLDEAGFPTSPVLGWSGGKVLGILSERGIKIDVVVGGPEVLLEAGGRGIGCYGFDGVEPCQRLKAWSELPERLK